jgi:hypothetical protein
VDVDVVVRTIREIRSHFSSNLRAETAMDFLRRVQTTSHASPATEQPKPTAGPLSRFVRAVRRLLLPLKPFSWIFLIGLGAT